MQPCAVGLVFAKSCQFDFVRIWNTCDRGDWLIWLLRRAGLMDKVMAVNIAVACAEHVLEKFESKYPGDKCPRLAIEKAKAWLKNPTKANAYAAAAYAAAAAAAGVELKWQADAIRKIVPCQFEN